MEEEEDLAEVEEVNVGNHVAVAAVVATCKIAAVLRHALMIGDNNGHVPVEDLVHHVLDRFHAIAPGHQEGK